MESNEILEKLPRHLMDLVIDQPYNDYTAQDHALWRYVMRRNVSYLSRVAHGSYPEGLKKTGVSVDTIPHMYGMNRILKEIGWAAVAVDGFIPPAAFMEFQAYNVLVIAADIRPIDQIEYTPAPDIIHEAAGHAPIIADPEYAEYLRLFGEIGSKAFSSEHDYKIYAAIRHLSILKADPYTTKEEILMAEKDLLELEHKLGPQSEMQHIRNLHWWTVEYGLIGDLKNPKIYGAGLLSSIGESISALTSEVKKIPYTIDAVNYNFDITTKQPQLFVTPDFQRLTDVLLEFKDQMALSRGGADGVLKAIGSNNTATLEYSSGLQVSGTFTELKINQEKPIFIRTEGPTNLNYNNKELPSHGKSYHNHGFSSPIGRWKGIAKAPELLNAQELVEAGCITDDECIIEFESGIEVKGRLIKETRKEGKLLLLSFSDCIVRFKNKVLFQPDWGIFDMAVGENISSAFSGPADPDAFKLQYPVPKEKTHKIIHDEQSRSLHNMYREIRKLREGEIKEMIDGNKGIKDSRLITDKLIKLANDLVINHPDDWLALLELHELAIEEKNKDAIKFLEKLLENISLKNKTYGNLISQSLQPPPHP